MAGSATVTIDEKVWECSLAQSVVELATGLSGVASMPANTGMLFDMGAEYSEIAIYTDEMLFNIDIVYMDADGIVVGVSEGVAPGDEEKFEAAEGERGARYFMEVNAGEAVDVEASDPAGIVVTQTPQNVIYTAIPAMIMLAMIVVAMRVMR